MVVSGRFVHDNEALILLLYIYEHSYAIFELEGSAWECFPKEKLEN